MVMIRHKSVGLITRIFMNQIERFRDTITHHEKSTVNA